MMFDNLIMPSTTIDGYNRRLSIVIIFLALLAVLLVITSVIAFVYVTRKEKLLRRCHLVSVIFIILIELAFLVGVVFCFSIQSRNIQGQILAALLIVVSFIALMTLIYFLLEDLLRERIEPYPTEITRSKSFTIETKPASRHPSPVQAAAPPLPPPPPQSPPLPPLVPPRPADETAIPIDTPDVLTSLPRIPTPPLPSASPPPPEKPASPSSEKPESPPPEKPESPPPSEKQPTPPPEQPASPSPESSIGQASELPPPYIVNYEKIRRDLLAAIEERTIPALEEAIQQVKDHDYIQPLKYECERALELLNRLMKIEHMKLSPVPWERIRVLRLNQATIAELHSYTKPPDEVSTVMRATFLLLGHSDREIMDWQHIQNLLGRFGRESVRRRCYELNPLNIPVDKAREAKDILRNYDILRVNEISVGLTAFFNWAWTMVEEREKLLESQRRLAR